MRLTLPSRLCVFTAVISIALAFCAGRSDAGTIIGRLESLTVDTTNPSQLAANFYLRTTSDSAGELLDFLNLDVVNSKINGTTIGSSQLSLFKFFAASPFDKWQRPDDQIGGAFGSEVIIDPYSVIPMEDPFGMPGAAGAEFLVGKFTIDISGFNIGDSVKLDITGAPAGAGGSSRSTSVGIIGVVDPVDPDFINGGMQSFTLTTGGGGGEIPEPASALIFLMGSVGVLAVRRRRK